MQGILNSFSTIINMAKTMIGVLVNFFTHIGDLFNLSAQATQTSLDIIDTFPYQIQYFALMTLLVSIIFLVLGRVGGKS